MPVMRATQSLGLGGKHLCWEGGLDLKVEELSQATVPGALEGHTSLLHALRAPSWTTGHRATKGVVALDLTQWNNPAMIIGNRLRELREGERLSQGDIERRTGLLPLGCYATGPGHHARATGRWISCARSD